MPQVGSSKTVLHVGCGQVHVLGSNGFTSPQWKEVRYDIDSSVQPDIVGSITNMSNVATETVDAVYSSHNIEHLYLHEVPVALREFWRVLKDDGFLLICCPDLQTVCQHVAEGHLLEPLYRTKAGIPISPIDILFGWRDALNKGNFFMAHRCGFTSKVLMQCLKLAGFVSIAIQQQKQQYALRALASKKSRPEQAMRELFGAYSA